MTTATVAPRLQPNRSGPSETERRLERDELTESQKSVSTLVGVSPSGARPPVNYRLLPQRGRQPAPLESPGHQGHPARRHYQQGRRERHRGREEQIVYSWQGALMRASGEDCLVSQ